MSGTFAVTWWGHSSATVELGGLRVALDPVLTDRLLHLRRYAAAPRPEAADADVVLISHAHADHCHLPSLRRMSRSATVVAAPGAAELVGRLGFREVVVAVPGARTRLGGDGDASTLEVEVLPADHDGRRLPLPGRRGTAVGFRVEGGGRSFWHPGDTGPALDLDDVGSVDLALPPIGGWGPTLGPEHLDPAQAAAAVAAVGATWALPVHWGTFWATGLRRVAPGRHERLFVTPGERFAEALGGEAIAVLPAHGERVDLGGGHPR